MVTELARIAERRQGLWLNRIKRSGQIVLAGGISGLVAGLIAGGAGSRIAMRIVALVAGKSFYGMQTEALETVGKITLDGTLFLLAASAFGSIPFGLAYVLLRPVLPGQPGWKKGAIYGGMLFAIFGSKVIDGENFDFRVFVSPYLAVGMFGLLFPLFGIITGLTSERIAPEAERPNSRLIYLIAWTPMMIASVIGLAKALAALQQIFA